MMKTNPLRRVVIVVSDRGKPFHGQLLNIHYVAYILTLYSSTNSLNSHNMTIQILTIFFSPIFVILYYSYQLNYMCIAILHIKM